MKILMINDHIHFGGGGDAVFRLERKAYEEAGFDVFTFSQAAERPANASAHDFVAIEPRNRSLQRVGKFLFSQSVSRSFRESLLHIRPDFISTHLVSKYPLSVYPQLGAYPVVQTLHGPNLFCATAWGCLKDGTTCEMGVGLKCCRRGCVSLADSLLYTSLYMRLLGSVKRNVDLFVCPSRQLCDSAESLGFTPAEFAPLGIDDQFESPLTDKPNGPVRILYVGALAEQKGVHILIEAFRLICERVSDVELLIAGHGPMAASLKQQSEAYGLGDKVRFLGFVPRSEILQLYRRATVLAVPSIWKEQFGLVGPEALATGTPCVGSNIGGIPEWLHDGKWGFLVPPRDPESLADKIVTLLEDPELRRIFGSRGRDWSLNQYSPDKYREYRLKLVRRILSTSRSES